MCVCMFLLSLPLAVSSAPSLWLISKKLFGACMYTWIYVSEVLALFDLFKSIQTPLEHSELIWTICKITPFYPHPHLSYLHNYAIFPEIWSSHLKQELLVFSSIYLQLQRLDSKSHISTGKACLLALTPPEQVALSYGLPAKTDQKGEWGEEWSSWLGEEGHFL